MAAIDYSKLSETEVEQFYAYGFAQYGTGNWGEAADVFRVLCTRRPLVARFWFGLGATLQGAENYMDALHAWAMAALLSTDDPYPHFHAAECYFSLLDSNEAAQGLKEAEARIVGPHPLRGKIALLREQWKVV
jgi:type III secretion system low calcium response chaperone LcrH/SycD